MPEDLLIHRPRVVLHEGKRQSFILDVLQEPEKKSADPCPPGGARPEVVFTVAQAHSGHKKVSCFPLPEAIPWQPLGTKLSLYFYGFWTRRLTSELRHTQLQKRSPGTCQAMLFPVSGGNLSGSPWGTKLSLFLWVLDATVDIEAQAHAAPKTVSWNLPGHAVFRFRRQPLGEPLGHKTLSIFMGFGHNGEHRSSGSSKNGLLLFPVSGGNLSGSPWGTKLSLYTQRLTSKLRHTQLQKPGTCQAMLFPVSGGNLSGSPWGTNSLNFVGFGRNG